MSASPGRLALALRRGRYAVIPGDLPQVRSRERGALRYLGRWLTRPECGKDGAEVIGPGAVACLVGSSPAAAGLRDGFQFVVHGQDDTANHLRIASTPDSVSDMRNPMTQASGEIHAARCQHCHRVLHSAASIARKAGRWCAAKAKRLAAVAKGFKAEQIARALEAIEDRAITASRRKGVFLVVSSRGDGTYLVTAEGQCNCPNQLRKGKADGCWHTAAARMAAATGKAA